MRYINDNFTAYLPSIDRSSVKASFLTLHPPFLLEPLTDLDEHLIVVLHQHAWLDDGAVGDPLLAAVDLFLHEFVGDVFALHLHQRPVQRSFDLLLRAASRVPPQTQHRDDLLLRAA